MQRVNVIGEGSAAMADLMRRDGVQVVRQTLRALDGDRYRVQAYCEPDAVDGLVAAGFGVESVREVALGDAPESAPVAQPRAARAGRGPDGYLSVRDVESRTARLAAAHPGSVALVELPNRTWEGRTSTAIRIGRGGADAPGILLLGGVHAREWGSPDILLSFAERLLAADEGGTDIVTGGHRFPAAQVRELLDDTSVYLFPQVNPDGRQHSLTVDPGWRKNRRPAPHGAHSPGCVGVDLNRNFDFLWNYPAAFHPQAAVASSTRPCDPQVYIGPGAASEPETRNVVWLLDEHPAIRCLVDLHSYGELIMYSWGDDQNQTDDPAMTFADPRWDGRRGVFDDEYREYLREGDHVLLTGLATAMQAGVEAVRGRRYTVQQSANLYPTSGTSDDYAYSRHIVDPAAPKVLAFTVEWGSENNPTPFHPPYREMTEIIAEVTGGLLEFCRAAARLDF